MRNIALLLFSFCCILSALAQKKPLDHTVYDGWQSIGEKLISNDGKWIVYTINPQEGDNELVIQSSGQVYKKTIARGYNALITEDSRFVIFKIKPFFKDTRDARIKKKKADELPKDSFAIMELGKDSLWKVAAVKTFKAPEKSYGWVAYHLEKKTEPPVRGRTGPDQGKLADSLARIIDSLQLTIQSLKSAAAGKQDKKGKRDEDDQLEDADGDEAGGGTAEAGTDLVLRNLQTGEERTFKNVLDYLFSKNGAKLLMRQSRNVKDTASKPGVLLFDLHKGFADTLARGGNDFKNLALSEDGSQAAFLAERDAKPKELQKFYKLWYYRQGMDSAVVLVDKVCSGMKMGMTVSENGQLSFSKSGKRLFFGTAPIQPPKDTTLVDIDLVKVDVWHYNDDYLQTTQLSRLRRDQQENFLAVYLLDQKKLVQLGSKEIPQIIQSNEGDGDQFAGITDVGRRIESQWTGSTKKDVYAIHVNDGTQKLVKKDLDGVVFASYVSPTGKYILWYDSKTKNYFAWDGETAKNITSKIKVPLCDEENDVPADPSPYGIMGWHEGDSVVYVYDRYDIWKVGLDGKNDVTNLTKGAGRKNKDIYRYVQLDPEKRFLKPDDFILVRKRNDLNKKGGLAALSLQDAGTTEVKTTDDSFSIGQILEAKDVLGRLIYTRENYQSPPDIYSSSLVPVYDVMNPIGILRYEVDEQKLSSINPQQKNYNWGTAELFKWKAYNGKESMGIVYKPEDFDPKKKYPMICYFYETLSDGLYSYQAPAPTPSRLNIPFFVSRGYVVFAPDIHYTTGHPGRDAYNYIVSGARALVKKGFVDSTRIGIQGQSWGGYQVAYLVTATNLFKAAWSGAPVANMTSAYGGIRWESGLNRQFQYEKTQSRIGATLWDKPQLYIENSPLFHLPKVKTPMVIMSNDADGAVPWYQGIELFTGMRRLNKKVWLLNYNGEAHNLIERRNRKDIQIREQQFFDWLLKGEKPARWLTDGVPAVNKGRDWGLEIVD